VEINGDPVSDCSYIVIASLAMAWIEFSVPLKNLLSKAFFIFLGKISFGLYISHYPFLFSASTGLYLLLLPHLGHFNAMLITVSLSLPAALGVGTVFYRIADAPSVRFSKWIASKIMGVQMPPTLAG
jgi:peptidoglycan/LPS O-acetylase OafA/YrhL